MNTCDYKIGCQTQKHEACKDTWNPAVKLGSSGNGTSIMWILVNMGWFRPLLPVAGYQNMDG